MTWLMNWLVPISLAAAGLGAYGLAGVRKVPALRVGIVYRRFGTHHRDGRFRGRVHGAGSPQASTLRAGRRYFRPRFLYKVEYVPVTYVPYGSIGVVVANSGAVPPPGQLLCRRVSCDNFQNGQDFLRNGGQMGRQADVLTAGTYHINPLLFEVVTIRTIGQGRHGLTAADLKEIHVPLSTTGVVIALAGAPPDQDDIPVGRRVPGHRSFQLASEFLRNQGQRGVQAETLSPGFYAINPWFARVLFIPTRYLYLKWSRKQSKPASNFDAALDQIVINVEGYRLVVTVTQDIWIPAQSAPRLVAAFGEPETAGWGASDPGNPAPVQRFVEKVLGHLVAAYLQATATELGIEEFIAAHDIRVGLELGRRIQQALAEWGVKAFFTRLDVFGPENADLHKKLREAREAEIRDDIRSERLRGYLGDLRMAADLGVHDRSEPGESFEEDDDLDVPDFLLGVHDRSEPGERAPGGKPQSGKAWANAPVAPPGCPRPGVVT